MKYAHIFAVAVALTLSAYSTGSFAAEVTPFSGTQTSESGEGYNIQVGDKTFTLSEMQRMPTFQSTFKTPYDFEGTFVGVKFVDVLRLAGIGKFKRLFVRAANDYKITVSSADVGIDQALLVYSLNGKLLALNDKGPYWLVWPQSAEAVLSGDAEAAKWAWSTVDIQKIN